MRRAFSALMFAALAATAGVQARQTAPPPAASAAQTGAQFYLQYRAAFEKAEAIEELLPFMSAARRKQIESEPPADRKETFDMIKMFDTTTGIKVVKETKTADGATLDVTGVDEGTPRAGTITLVREGTAWKIDRESWKSGAR
jgi:hypothetical protein